MEQNDNDMVMTAFRLTRKELDKVDELARRTERNRSQMLRWLINRATIELEPRIVVAAKGAANERQD